MNFSGKGEQNKKFAFFSFFLLQLRKNKTQLSFNSLLSSVPFFDVFYNLPLIVRKRGGKREDHPVSTKRRSTGRGWFWCFVFCFFLRIEGKKNCLEGGGRNEKTRLSLARFLARSLFSRLSVTLTRVMLGGRTKAVLSIDLVRKLSSCGFFEKVVDVVGGKK